MQLPRTTFIARVVYAPKEWGEGAREDLYRAFWFCKDYMRFCLEWIAFENQMAKAYPGFGISDEGVRAIWRYRFCDDAIHEVLIPAEPRLRPLCDCDRCRQIDQQRRRAAWALNDASFGYRRVRVSERNRVGVEANSLLASHGAGRVVPATLEKFTGRSNDVDAAPTGAGGEARHAQFPSTRPAQSSSAYRSRAPPERTSKPYCSSARNLAARPVRAAL